MPRRRWAKSGLGSRTPVVIGKKDGYIDQASDLKNMTGSFGNFHFALAGVITEVEADTDDFA